MLLRFLQTFVNFHDPQRFDFDTCFCSAFLKQQIFTGSYFPILEVHPGMWDSNLEFQYHLASLGH